MYNVNQLIVALNTQTLYNANQLIAKYTDLKCICLAFSCLPYNKSPNDAEIIR